MNPLVLVLLYAVLTVVFGFAFVWILLWLKTHVVRSGKLSYKNSSGHSLY